MGSGREAVEALTRQAYNLVLLEVHLPEMDGWEATRLIRAPHPGVPGHRLPIIGLTAHPVGRRAGSLPAGSMG